jgi:hypothetical protein
LFARSLAGAVLARTRRIGADRRDVHQPFDPGRRRQARHAARPFGMDALEIAAAAFGQDARQVDHQPGAFHRAMHRRLVFHRGEQRHDLPHRAGGLEEQRCLWVADCDAHHKSLMRQPLNHVTADEAGAAEHRRHVARRHCSVLLSLRRWGFVTVARRRLPGI